MTAQDNTALPPLTPPSPSPPPAASVAMSVGALDGVVERFAREYFNDRRRECGL